MFQKPTDEQMEDLKKRLQEQGINEERSYLSLGITPDYAWYESEQIQRKIDEFNSRFKHLVKVMEERHADQNKLIDQLMQENKLLARQLKEKE
jgi:phosphopantetheine adenylyltransferase